jgi:type I restriction enzyme, S subunit
MTDTLTSHDIEEGELPEGWVANNLAEAAEVVMGQSPPGSTYNENGAGMPFFQGKAEFGALHPSVRKWTTAGKRFAQVGDILMSVRAPVGPTNLADIDCVIGRGLAAIRAREHVDQAFLLWNLRHFEDEIAARGTGTTFDSISGGALRSQNVNIPPLLEQERIVEILEDQLSHLDTARHSVHTVREKAAQFRRSLLHAAFTGALTGHDVEEGELPEGWKRPLLDEINDPDRPICYGILMPGPDLSEGVPYVKVKNMRDNRVLLEGVHRTSPEIEQKFARSRLRAGDLLLSIRGTFGKTAIVPSELDGGNVTQDTARIAPIGAKTPYLFRYLQSPQAQNFFKTVARGVAVRGVNIRDLRQLPVVVPSLPEQDRIVEILEEQLSRLDASLAVADAVEERSTALRRSLLHSAFTGRLTEEWREAVNV